MYKTVRELAIGERARVKFTDGEMRLCIFSEVVGIYGLRKVIGSKKKAIFGGLFEKIEGKNYYTR